MHLRPLPAFADNYIWTLADDDGRAVVVDPGEASPVLASGLKPVAVLLTHHHNDHIGGTAELLARWPDLVVAGPADPRIPLAVRTVREGDRVEANGWTFAVMEVPGHTRTHVAFHGEGLLFCGDTLFSLGCGRLFEGAAEDLHGSLTKLAALPPETRVCCGHEYTVTNAHFARVVEPRNPALQRRAEEAQAMRDRGMPTLPSRLGDELQANPFLRVRQPDVRAAVAAHIGRMPDDDVETFAELRRWKDGFAA